MDLALKQEVFGNHYGIKRGDIMDDDGFVITELHPNIVPQALKTNPNILTIGLITKDLGLLQERLIVRRQSETKEEAERRLAMASLETENIMKNSQLYRCILEVTRENEGTILDTFLGELETILADN